MRRGWGVLVLALLWSSVGAAQPPSIASPPAAPPAAGVFEPRNFYDPPPPSLLLSQSYSIDALRGEIGNVARWRDRERARIGVYEAVWRNERRVVRNALPQIGGYYAFFGNADFPAGIVEASWNDEGSEIGRPSTVRGSYVAPRSVCGGAIAYMRADIASSTYLGSSWREEFSVLEVELAALTPMPEGPQIGAGVPIVPNSLPNSSRFYPQRALEREIEGQVMLGCFVRPDLSLRCGVVSETPPGWGFGQAAQEIFSRVRAEPQARNGEPSAGACTPYAVPFRLM